ncbi:hypothetical protein [Anaerovorax odorimutans]|uniref:hypothetical protein n=1 Tax=Anaerovorax odorimutans TaxID=109327 RepID=UPI0012EBE153|nr:hypothetical protein [Anaerovorax odorimutans]
MNHSNMTQAAKHDSMNPSLQQRCLNHWNYYIMTQAAKHDSMIPSLQQHCLNHWNYYTTLFNLSNKINNFSLK